MAQVPSGTPPASDGGGEGAEKEIGFTVQASVSQPMGHEPQESQSLCKRATGFISKPKINIVSNL